MRTSFSIPIASLSPKFVHLARVADAAAQPNADPTQSSPPTKNAPPPTATVETLADLASLLGLDPTATMDDVMATVAALPQGDDGTDAAEQVAARLCSPRELAMLRETGIPATAYVTNRFNRKHGFPLVKLADPKPTGRPAADYRAGDFNGYPASNGNGPNDPAKLPTAKPLAGPTPRPVKRIVEPGQGPDGLSARELAACAEMGVDPKVYAEKKRQREAARKGA